MQLEELMDNVEDNYIKIIKDYIAEDLKLEPIKIKDKILNLESDEITDLESIIKLLGYGKVGNLVEMCIRDRQK